MRKLLPLLRRVRLHFICTSLSLSTVKHLLNSAREAQGSCLLRSQPGLEHNRDALWGQGSRPDPDDPAERRRRTTRPTQGQRRRLGGQQANPISSPATSLQPSYSQAQPSSICSPAICDPAICGPATSGPAICGPAISGQANSGPAARSPAGSGPAINHLQPSQRAKPTAATEDQEPTRMSGYLSQICRIFTFVLSFFSYFYWSSEVI